MTRHDGVEHFRKVIFCIAELFKNKSRKGKQWATKLGLLTYQKKMW